MCEYFIEKGSLLSSIRFFSGNFHSRLMPVRGLFCFRAAQGYSNISAAIEVDENEGPLFAEHDVCRIDIIMNKPEWVEVFNSF